MSEFHVEVVEIGPIRKHPNADTLSITDIHGGYPVIFRTGDYEAGGKAVYVPIEAVVPARPEWEFMGRRKRVTAKKLRGVFSMGLLTPCQGDWAVGQDVQAELGIEKYEPPIKGAAGHQRGIDPDASTDPHFMPHYDIDALRRYGRLLEQGEEVIVTEKLHGASSRYAFHNDTFWVGSRKQMKKLDSTNIWTRIAEKYGLEAKLRDHPGVGLYGEVFGWVQDLRYGHSQNQFSLAIFDVYDIVKGKFYDYDDAKAFVDLLGLPYVPFLYRGPWSTEVVVPLAEGQTTINDTPHVREGFVVKPVRERWNERVGRVILKMHGEGFLIKDGARDSAYRIGIVKSEKRQWDFTASQDIPFPV